MKLFLEKFIRSQPTKTNLLLKEAEIARREWHDALQQLHHITDTYMLDHVIHKINSTEQRFVALLKQAQSEGLVAWPGQLNSPQPVQAIELSEKTLNEFAPPINKEATG